MRVYRLVTGKSIESKILDRARCKKKLGNLVLGHDGRKTLLNLDELSELLNEENELAVGVGRSPSIFACKLKRFPPPPPKKGQGELVTDEELFVWHQEAKEEPKEVIKQE